ncbi:hypothetical protein [Sabulibacter ruber]|uniref:hypothetical protein n=1 Tax=Sabulibacter ruber TaxID=2811901 RepID=UPI001A95F45E|nr:hypothetical protein [Sabulibacter ruber]
MMDDILREMYGNVGWMEKPEDFPVESSKVSDALGQVQEKMLPEYRSLSEEGMLKISVLAEPPLLYLTLTGIARAKRL